MTHSRALNQTGMEVWFAEKTYTAMAVQAVVGATALGESVKHKINLILPNRLCLKFTFNCK